MKKEIRLKIQGVSVLLFAGYMVCLIYFLFFSDGFGRVCNVRAYAYNLELFKEIKRFWNYREELGIPAVFINIVGNIICFLPFGFVLPVLSRRARNFFVITVLSFDFSLLVECVQLFFQSGQF